MVIMIFIAMKKIQKKKAQMKAYQGEQCTRGRTRNWWGRYSWQRLGRRRNRCFLSLLCYLMLMLWS